MPIEYGKITYGPGNNWSCACGDGSSGQSAGVRYKSFEEACKRAEKHLERCTFTYDDDLRREPTDDEEPVRLVRNEHS